MIKKNDAVTGALVTFHRIVKQYTNHLYTTQSNDNLGYDWECLVNVQ